jgi:hypothetical protein
MLKIYLGNSEDIDVDIEYPDSAFKYEYKVEWFDDSLVKEMVKDVDKTIVESAYRMDSEILGPINCSMLSGGVKMLIMALKADDIYSVNGDSCGDNCGKWSIEIGKHKDLTISLSYLMFLPGEFEIEVINTKKIIHNYYEFLTEAQIVLSERDDEE